jgi:hypothetical protein
MRRVELALLVALGLLAACQRREQGAGKEPRGQVVRDGPPPGSGPGHRPAEPQEQAQSRYFVNAKVLEVHDDALRVLSTAGEQEIQLARGTFLPRWVAPGSLVDLDCARDSQERLELFRVQSPKGLPVDFGRVARLDTTEVTIENKLGSTSYDVSPWSDLPRDLASGDFVTLKFFDLGGRPTILNVREQAGHLETAGIVRAISGTHVRIQTIKDEVGLDLPAVDVDGLAPGSLVVVSWTGDADGQERILDVKRQDELTFIGKFQQDGENPGEVKMVDAWGGTLGVVGFRMAGGEGFGTEVSPGDLVEVLYGFSPREADNTPIIRSWKKRVLSQVWFGQIEAIDARHVEMVTLQKQAHTARIDGETTMPFRIAAGDMADVAWVAAPDGGLPFARLIVKE